MTVTCIKALEVYLAALRQEYERLSLGNYNDYSFSEAEMAYSKIKQEMRELEEGIEFLKSI